MTIEISGPIKDIIGQQKGQLHLDEWKLLYQGKDILSLELYNSTHDKPYFVV